MRTYGEEEVIGLVADAFRLGAQAAVRDGASVTRYSPRTLRTIAASIVELRRRQQEPQVPTE